MRPLARRTSFVLGTLALCGLSRLAGDPAWDIPLSVIMATATYLTAPYVVTTWLARRVMARSVVYWLGSTAATFDIYQIARTGSWRPDWTLANLAASTTLYVCAGLAWDAGHQALLASSQRRGRHRAARPRGLGAMVSADAPCPPRRASQASVHEVRDARFALRLR